MPGPGNAVVLAIAFHYDVAAVRWPWVGVREIASNVPLESDRLSRHC
jgi:hypothetical protein